jgi:hypothetical protein
VADPPVGLAGAASARVLPSPASSGARWGSDVSRLSSSPGRRPGNSSECDHTTRAPTPATSSSVTSNCSESVPNRRVCTRTGTATAPSGASCASPVTRMLLAVAVVSACWYTCANSPAVIVCCEAAVRSEYMPRYSPRVHAVTYRCASAYLGEAPWREPSTAPAAKATAASTSTGRARCRRWLRFSATEPVEHDR